MSIADIVSTLWLMWRLMCSFYMCYSVIFRLPKLHISQCEGHASNTSKLSCQTINMQCRLMYVINVCIIIVYFAIWHAMTLLIAPNKGGIHMSNKLKI